MPVGVGGRRPRVPTVVHGSCAFVPGPTATMGYMNATTTVNVSLDSYVMNCAVSAVRHMSSDIPPYRAVVRIISLAAMGLSVEDIYSRLMSGVQ